MFKWIKEIAKKNARSCARPNHCHRQSSRARNYFRPRLEVLEDRLAPATVNLYWDPTSGANASTAANWDVGSLGSGTKATAAPGNTAGETDNVIFDGTAGQGGNKSCTWDYTPANTLGYLSFQNGWTQTVSFLDKQGLSVSSDSQVTRDSAPTITPNGSSGSNAVAAITLTKGAKFLIQGESNTLFLTGYSSGNAIFFAGDGTAGEYLSSTGNVVYTGQSSSGSTANVDYLKIPVLNSIDSEFKVNGNGTGAAGSIGAVLQVSGTDSSTNNVSFYQNESTAETVISGNGTLWCYNNYTMTAGQFATTDAYTDILEVGTSGNSPVDGTVTFTGGTVFINPGLDVYGTLQIMGTTGANVPILNIGAVQLNFKVNQATGSTQCDQLIVGDTNGSGKVNFGYDGTTTLMDFEGEGSGQTGHHWPVIYYGSVTGTGSVEYDPSNWTLNWNSNNLEIAD
jgi:hypothetical protein